MEVLPDASFEKLLVLKLNPFLVEGSEARLSPKKTALLPFYLHQHLYKHVEVGGE